ncbi:MAG: class I SAM-dependent methyltransferase [Propionibacteriales bacterium]|nr:class I SAM-dependent methyltransferase [Propionibacteriales bacterium]
MSLNWGFDRGTPIDRHFIEGFLSQRRADIGGRVLEVKDAGYTRRFGSHVTAVDVLDIDPLNSFASIIGDLTDMPHVGSDTFDCVLLTQTLHLVYDYRRALTEVRRILRPGGILLVTMPSLSRTSRELHGSDYWRMTPTGVSRLLSDVFGGDNVEVTSAGNAVLCAAFVVGVAVEEVRPRLLREQDPLFPLVVTARAIKR